MADHELVPVEQQHGEADVWQQAGLSRERILGGVHLGRIVGRDGWGAGFRDSAEQEAPDTGMIVGAEQGSAGFTGVYVKPAGAEYEVAALNPDASSRETIWQTTEREDGKTQVNSDYGNIGRPGTSGQSLSQEEVGNPGNRGGIVRVTNRATGEERYFIIGVNFVGEPDDWRVSGTYTEVKLSDQLLLGPGAPMLTGDTPQEQNFDLADEETMHMSLVDHQVADNLHRAFRHATPDVWVLHSSPASASNVARFARLNLDLLTEMARTFPIVFEGTGKILDEMGRRARLVDDSRPKPMAGYLDAIHDDQAARVQYLERLQEAMKQEPNDSNTFYMMGFVQESFKLLEAALSNHVVLIQEGSPLDLAIKAVIQEGQRAAEEATSKRQGALQNTILDPEHPDTNVDHLVIQPGEQMHIDLTQANPLLTAEQTYQAYYSEGRTDGGSVVPEGYQMPALAMLQINGQDYLVVDASSAGRYSFAPNGGRTPKAYGQGSNPYSKDDNPLRILRTTGATDSLYGQQVTAQSVSIDSRYFTSEVMDWSHVDAHGYSLPEAHTGVTLTRSATGDLVITAPANLSVGVVARKGQASIGHGNS